MTIYCHFIFNRIAIESSDGLTKMEAQVKKNGRAPFSILKRNTFLGGPLFDVFMGGNSAPARFAPY